MSRPKPPSPPRVLVVDIGGSNVKLLLGGQREKRKIPTGRSFAPKHLIGALKAHTTGWNYGAVSVGFPAPIVNQRAAHEPTNLGGGWSSFDFSRISNRPVRVVNDAAMQALGSWQKGRMLFLGLGTGLGSALVVEGLVLPLELCEMRFSRGKSLEQAVGKAALKSVGKLRWQAAVNDVLGLLQKAFLPDAIVVGGGNAKFLGKLPPGVLLGKNAHALRGGERLWETTRTSGGKPRLRWRIA